MKHILLYLFLLTGFATQAQSQPDDNRKEDKIQALYIAYITRELNLSEDEAQKFWPIHAQYDSELKSVSLDMPELERQQATLNIKKKYQERFTRVLGPARTNNFFQKDGEFRKKLIERLKAMRQQNQLNNRPRQNLRKN